MISGLIGRVISLLSQSSFFRWRIMAKLYTLCGQKVLYAAKLYSVYSMWSKLYSVYYFIRPPMLYVAIRYSIQPNCTQCTQCGHTVFYVAKLYSVCPMRSYYTRCGQIVFSVLCAVTLYYTRSYYAICGHSVLCAAIIHSPRLFDCTPGCIWSWSALDKPPAALLVFSTWCLPLLSRVVSWP